MTFIISLFKTKVVPHIFQSFTCNTASDEFLFLIKIHGTMYMYHLVCQLSQGFAFRVKQKLMPLVHMDCLINIWVIFLVLTDECLFSHVYICMRSYFYTGKTSIFWSFSFHASRNSWNMKYLPKGVNTYWVFFVLFPPCMRSFGGAFK